MELLFIYTVFLLMPFQHALVLFSEHIMSYSIEQIINRPDTWQGSEGRSNSRVILTTKSANADWHNRQSIPTGFESLDKELHLNGWPTHGAVEVLSDQDGAECMGLFLPTMQKLASEKRWQAFINAHTHPMPHYYAPTIFPLSKYLWFIQNTVMKRYGLPSKQFAVQPAAPYLPG